MLKVTVNFQKKPRRQLPSTLTPGAIREARKNERRDCRHFEHDCLMKAALADVICVPCMVDGKRCRRFRRKSREIIEREKESWFLAAQRLLDATAEGGL